jgi:hypothetical protein
VYLEMNSRESLISATPIKSSVNFTDHVQETKQIEEA